jgi:spoIIIJ-associated protein
MKDELTNITKDLLTLIETQAEIEVVENEDSLDVNFSNTQDAGLLIGFRGENISAFQTILAMILKQRTGEWKRVNVNIGDYKEKQEEKLKNLAEQSANRAVETGSEEPIYNLTPSQRRIIHMYLSERKDVVTESVGVEPERYLVVKPK